MQKQRPAGRKLAMEPVGIGVFPCTHCTVCQPCTAPVLLIMMAHLPLCHIRPWVRGTSTPLPEGHRNIACGDWWPACQDLTQLDKKMTGQGQMIKLATMAVAQPCSHVHSHRPRHRPAHQRCYMHC